MTEHHLSSKHAGRAADQVELIATEPKKPYSLFEHTLTISQLHFYISESIEAPERYTDMIHRILTAAPNDVVYIHLNTPGGRLDTSVQLINAMQQSAAKIVTCLESVAHSAGSMIFLSGDEMIVNDNCMMMIHNYSGGVIGKGHEIVSELDAMSKWISMFGKKIYVPFLTEDEFGRVIRGEDIWLQSSDIRKRLDRVVKMQTQEDNAKKAPRSARKKKTPDATPQEDDQSLS